MSSTGLISCIRENSPPMEIAASESRVIPPSSDSGKDSEKPRRFHALRNFRRIFRRQTMSATHSFGPLASSTSSTQLQQSSQLTGKNSSVTPMFALTNDETVQPLADLGRRSLKSEIQALHLIDLKTSRDRGIDTVSSMNFERQSTSGALYANESFGEQLPTVTHSNVEDPEGKDIYFERCLSQAQSVGSDCSGKVTLSSLSQGLKFELFDIVQELRNIPDASRASPGLPRCPQTKLQPISLKGVPYPSLLGTTSSQLNNNPMPAASLNHFNGDRTDEPKNSSFCYSEEFSCSEIAKNLVEIDLNVPSEARLSHAAAHHKIAVRPKKKEPIRLHKTKELSFRMSMPDVTSHLQEDSTKCGFILVDKIKPFPSHVNENIFQQDSSVICNEISRSMICNENEINSVPPAVSSAPCNAENICNDQLLKNDYNHELDVKRFLHRSSRDIKRFDNHSDHDVSETIFSGLVNHETPSNNNQIKSTSREIYRKEVSSKISLGTNASLFSPNCPFTFDNIGVEGQFEKKVVKSKSGPASRQRVQPKDLSPQALHSDNSIFNHTLASPFENANFEDDFPTAQDVSNSVENSVLEKQIEAELLLNEESEIPNEINSRKNKVLSTLNNTPECLENNESKNDCLNLHKQSTSRMESTTTYPWKQKKSVEKSKSFRCNDEAANHQPHFKKQGNMPSLPDLRLYSDSVRTEMKRTTNDEKELVTFPSSSFELCEKNVDNTINCKSTLMQTRGSTVTLISSPSYSSKNITEIEERIDNLVKSSYISVLKSEDCWKNVLTIVPTDITRDNELSATERCLKAENTSLNFFEKTLLAPGEIFINNHRIDSKPMPLHLPKTNNFKSTPSQEKPTFLETRFLKEETKLPEFMKIQLNRVDSPRPQTNLIFSKNNKKNVFQLDRNLDKKFSNEVIDNKTSLQLPTTASKTSYIRNKRNGTIVEAVMNRIVKNPQLEESVENEQSINVDSKNLLKNTGTISVLNVGSSLKEENTKLRNKSEDSNAEKSKYMKEPVCDFTEKEIGGILRKKNLITKKPVPDNKDDTPELMKVFARRSLKLRDTENLQNSINEPGNTDSNKENKKIKTTKLLHKNEMAIVPKEILPNKQIAIKNCDLLVKSNAALVIQTRSSKLFPKPLRFNAPSCSGNMPTDLPDTKRPTTSTQLQSMAKISINKDIDIISNEHTQEFKGILQRRAEWEQRAKEALK